MNDSETLTPEQPPQELWPVCEECNQPDRKAFLIREASGRIWVVCRACMDGIEDCVDSLILYEY